MPLGVQIVLLVAAAYIVGGIPMGLLVGRAKGIDIRKHGSGNIGATNIARTIGPYFGVLVLLLDAAKGAAASLAAACYLDTAPAAAELRHAYTGDLLLAGVAAACVTGNTASVFIRFKGGKGVATALGVLLGIYPFLTWPVLISVGLWLVVVGRTRYVSLGSLAAAGTVPIAFLACAYFFKWELSRHWPLLGLTIALAIIVFIRHRGNIGRLRDGTEKRIGQPGGAAPARPDA